MERQELEVLQRFEAVKALFQKVDRQIRLVLVGWLLSVVVLVLGLRLLGAAR